MKLFQLTWMFPILLGCTGSALANFTVLYEWNYIDYTWTSSEQKETAIECGEYNPLRIIPEDVQPLLDGRVLVTTPKYNDNPASVSVISNETGDGGSLLSPYPDWSWHKKAGDCSGITNAARAKLDECNRLWIVDSGIIGNTVYCPPKVLIFNPTSDELIDRIDIPKEVTFNPDDMIDGYLEVQTIETGGENCAETWAYIAQVNAKGGLVVFDYAKRSFWRHNDPIFAPETSGSNFTIDGNAVSLSIGLHSMIKIPTTIVSKDSYLFKPMSTYSAYGVASEGLHTPGANVTYYKTNYSTPSQELERDFSSSGIMVSGFSGFIACWNTQYPLVDPYVVILQQSTEIIPFVTGARIAKIAQNGVEGENVWMMAPHIERYILDTLDVTETNFRLLGANLANLVAGTNCEPTTSSVAEDLTEKTFAEYKVSAI